MDNEMTIDKLKDLVQEFCEERDWTQFHNPKDLAIGISTEANELLEIFRFQTDRQMKSQLEEADTREHIEEEIADTLFFILRFAQMYDIDLATAVADKIGKNKKKYPLEKTRSSNQKYKYNER